MSNGRIFISYRREDTSGESGRLKDKLEQVFGQENIFYDVETLEAGLNFDQSIAKALSESKVLLAMIGPHWLKVTDSKGTLRIQKSDDWVRKEISEALRQNLRVIPVLVNGAEMPDQGDLPSDLAELSLKHAQELTSSRWNYDVGELTKVLEKIIAKKPEPKPQPRPNPTLSASPISKPKSWWAKNYLWILGGVVAFFILVGMCVPDEDYSTPIDSEEIVVEQSNIPLSETTEPSQASADPQIIPPVDDEIDEDPIQTTTVNLIYTGDHYGCVLNLQISIGNTEFTPTENPFSISGIELGNQFYTIEGQITCPNSGNCVVFGGGAIHVSPNANYYIVWSNSAPNQCSMELQFR